MESLRTIANSLILNISEHLPTIFHELDTIRYMIMEVFRSDR